MLLVLLMVTITTAQKSSVRLKLGGRGACAEIQGFKLYHEVILFVLFAIYSLTSMVRLTQHIPLEMLVSGACGTSLFSVLKLRLAEMEGEREKSGLCKGMVLN